MKYSNFTKLTVLFFASIISINALAQSSRSVNVNNFNNIGVSSGIDLYLTQGNSESLVIKGREEIIKNVIVEQKNGGLTIKYKEGINWKRLFKDNDIDVYVTYKNLTALSASGGSDVNTQNTLKTNKISISASGGSDMELNIVCKDISIAASGGSDIDLKGSAENMVLNSSGGSDIDAYSFKVNYAKVNTTGGSDANIYVEKGLEANATGGSDIKYKGGAALKKTSNSKSGDVIHVN